MQHPSILGWRPRSCFTYAEQHLVITEPSAWLLGVFPVIIRLVTSAACRPDAAQRVHYSYMYLLILIALLCYLLAISGGMRRASDVALTVAYVL